MKAIALTGGVGHVREDTDPPVLPDPVAAADAAALQALIDDVQTLKATVKAAASGPLTLTRGQTLTILRASLFLLKGDKSS